MTIKLRYWVNWKALVSRGLFRFIMPMNRMYAVKGYVPYGWQFPDEEVFICAQKGFRLNCWAMISRQNQCVWQTTIQNIDSQFIFEQFDNLSLSIHQPTYVILDNARIHHAKIIQERISIWQRRGLYIFFLPTYSPHLNIAETLWRQLKTGWLNTTDYYDQETLAYAVNRCLANVGNHLNINFSPFNAN